MAVKRDAKGRLLPGASLNPEGVGGKHRAYAKQRVNRILEECAPDAAEKLVSLINHADDRLAAKVSFYVIDQVVGKALNQDGAPDGKPTNVNLTINGQAIRRPDDEQDEDEQPEEEAVQ